MILIILLYFGMMVYLAMYVGSIYGVYLMSKTMIQNRPEPGIGIMRTVAGYGIGLVMLAACGSFVYVSTFMVLPRFFA